MYETSCEYSWNPPANRKKVIKIQKTIMHTLPVFKLADHLITRFYPTRQLLVHPNVMSLFLYAGMSLLWYEKPVWFLYRQLACCCAFTLKTYHEMCGCAWPGHECTAWGCTGWAYLAWTCLKWAWWKHYLSSKVNNQFYHYNYYFIAQIYDYCIVE